jgi:hypothetical protein
MNKNVLNRPWEQREKQKQQTNKQANKKEEEKIVTYEL